MSPYFDDGAGLLIPLIGVEAGSPYGVAFGPGVYLLRCASCDDTYVGEAVCLRRRWKAHSRSLFNGSAALRLQEGWNRCGGEHFTLAVLEKVSEDAQRHLATCGPYALDQHLGAREAHWIAKLRPTLNTRV